MSNDQSVKRAKGCVNKGQRRRQANKAAADSGDIDESPWKRSRKQGVKKATAAVGEEVLQNMVSQFKKAASKEVADGVLKGALP